MLFNGTCLQTRFITSSLLNSVRYHSDSCQTGKSGKSYKSRISYCSGYHTLSWKHHGAKTQGGTQVSQCLNRWHMSINILPRITPEKLKPWLVQLCLKIWETFKEKRLKGQMEQTSQERKGQDLKFIDTAPKLKLESHLQQELQFKHTTAFARDYERE